MISDASWPQGRRSPFVDTRRRIPSIGAAAWPIAVAAAAIAVGVSSTHSLLVAGGLIAPLGIVLAGDLPIGIVLGGLFILRVLLDERSGAAGQQSTSINPSAIIALVLLALAGGALYRYRRGLRIAAFSVFAFVAAVGIGALQTGGSSVVIRESLREASIVAVALIALNFPDFGIRSATRIVQIAGCASAAIAIYQGLTGGGMLIAGTVRSNGTFSHPNSAAVYFAIAAIASLWRYFDAGRRAIDGLFLLLYVTAAIFTFSLGGMAALVAMFLAYGALRRGSLAIKLGAWFVTGALVVIFMATPLGASRLASESSSSLGTTYAANQSSNSINWRIYNWRTLIPLWKKSPIVGQGLGSTVGGTTPTGEAPHNEYIRYLVETGIVGLAAVASAIWLLIRALRRTRRWPETSTYGVLGLALMVGILLNALVANTLLYTPGAYAVALIVAAVLRPDQRSAPSPAVE